MSPMRLKTTVASFTWHRAPGHVPQSTTPPFFETSHASSKSSRRAERGALVLGDRTSPRIRRRQPCAAIRREVATVAVARHDHVAEGLRTASRASRRGGRAHRHLRSQAPRGPLRRHPRKAGVAVERHSPTEGPDGPRTARTMRAISSLNDESDTASAQSSSKSAVLNLRNARVLAHDAHGLRVEALASPSFDVEGPHDVRPILRRERLDHVLHDPERSHRSDPCGR